MRPPSFWNPAGINPVARRETFCVSINFTTGTITGSTRKALDIVGAVIVFFGATKSRSVLKGGCPILTTMLSLHNSVLTQQSARVSNLNGGTLLIIISFSGIRRRTISVCFSNRVKGLNSDASCKTLYGYGIQWVTPRHSLPLRNISILR